jgi:hypothetical protein
MRDDELSTLLRSPALALDPPPDLVEGVRSGARRVRRRQVAGASALSVVLLGAAALAGTGLLGGDTQPPRDTVAVSPGDPRFPEATTPVVRLAELNGGEVLTFFVGQKWCTAAVRVGTADACSRALGAQVQPFAFLRRPGNESLTVDADTLAAGVLGTDVARVELRFTDGSEVEAATTSPRGFPWPVWWAQVPRGERVESYTAYDDAGEELAVEQG